VARDTASRAVGEEKRPYHSPIRQARSAQTRERIIDAACSLLEHTSIRDWGALTLRGVAREATVNERTVYRYFTSERGLRDAVMNRLEEQAGIDLAGLNLGDIAKMASRVFEFIARFPLEPKPQLDPTLNETTLRQRTALQNAVTSANPGCDAIQAAEVAAVFDVLWSVAASQRLTQDWRFTEPQASHALTWAIEVIADAVRAGNAPGALEE
jgi:AcrR family transcriptional regulator